MNYDTKIMLKNNQYQKYFDEYNDYADKNLLGNRYIKLGTKVEVSKNYQILHYKKLSSRSNRTFLVIPSIFNSAEILFLSKSQSFIDNLRQYGQVFLINWLEVSDTNYLLDDYVLRVLEIITKLKQNNLQIDLVGHCLGGIIGVAASAIKPETIRTLTLLSTPWDFSHFTTIRTIYHYLNLDNYLKDLSIIPKLHIQILFFLLFPNYFNEKIDKFFSITNIRDKDLFFRVENWLLSSIALPKGVYRQIMDDIIMGNMLANGKWTINDKVINPALIEAPVYQVIANQDEIAPRSSILSLHRLFKKSTIYEVDGGHISYLIKDKINNLFKEYAK